MTNNYLLDTNIVIEWFAGGPSQKHIESLLKATEGETFFYISFITVFEFLIKADTKSETRFLNIIDSNEWAVLYFDDIRELKLASRISKDAGLSIPDAIILGSAKLLKATLLTRDKDLHKKGRGFCDITLLD